MDLKDLGQTLPPGFRFFPSDEELVCHYLYKKIAGEQVSSGTLVEIDLHTCEPWQLPEVAKLNSNEWYFFSFRDRKYATGFRTNRATTSGYWKATGKDRVILDPVTRVKTVGTRKTLVFYRNRAPNGIKTGWIMHEFRLENPLTSPPKEDWVLCRVFHKGKEEEMVINSVDNAITNHHHLFETISTPRAAALVPAAAAADYACSLPTFVPYPPQQHNHSNMISFAYERNRSQITNGGAGDNQHHHHDDDDEEIRDVPQINQTNNNNNNNASKLALLLNPKNKDQDVQLFMDSDHSFDRQHGSLMWDVMMTSFEEDRGNETDSSCCLRNNGGDDQAFREGAVDVGYHVHDHHLHHGFGDVRFEDQNNMVLL